MFIVTQITSETKMVFAMPLLQAKLKQEDVKLVMVPWDGTINALPNEPCVVRYSSRLDITTIIAESDNLEDTKWAAKIAQENQELMAKHCHTDSGSKVQRFAHDKGNLLIYEDRIITADTKDPHRLPLGNEETFQKLWEAIHPFIV